MHNYLTPTILSIENTTSLCSVCINYKKKIIYKEVFKKNENSKFLLKIINSLLKNYNISYTSINCIALGIGPGSQTGIKIMTSIAQGLSIGWKIPIIKISSLSTLALEAFYTYKSEKIFAAIDIKMGEICYGIYVYKNFILKNLINRERTNQSIKIKLKYLNVIGVGNGCYKYQTLLKQNNKFLKIKTKIIFPKAIYTNILAIEKFKIYVKTKQNQATPIYFKINI